MNLNVGSGVHPCTAPEWINFDYYPENGKVEVQGSATQLPFAPDTMDRVYFGHTLEHLSYGEDALEALLESWWVLKVGGILGVVGPAMDLAIATDQPQFLLDAIEEHIIEDKPGAGHMWTADSFNTLQLVKSVFPNARLVDVGAICRQTGWPNEVTAPWQVAILATKERV